MEQKQQFKQVPQIQSPHRQQMSSYQGNMMSYVNNMGMQNYIPPHEMVYHGQPPMPFQDSYAQNNEMYQKQNQTNEPHDYEYMLPHSTTGIGKFSIFLTTTRNFNVKKFSMSMKLTIS